MKIAPLLKDKQDRLISQWMDCVLDAYPEETRRFLKSQADVFANPVGATLQEDIEALWEWLLEQNNEEKVGKFLDKIIRIRALQDLSIKQAVGFIFQLKSLVRKTLAKQLADTDLGDDLHEFDNRVDDLALRAFEIYAGCRDEINSIRVKEMERNLHLLLRRAKLVSYVPPDDGLQAEPDIITNKD